MKGLGVSPGIAIGRARIIEKDEAVATGILLSDDESLIMEIGRFDQAVSASVDEVEAIRNNSLLQLTGESIEILETQVEFLTDPEIREKVVAAIMEEKITAADALIATINALVKQFKEMPDEYLSARAADIQDVGNRLLKQLKGNELAGTTDFEKNTILIAADMSPSDTLTLDLENIAGFATIQGGRTSHAAIIARARAVPAVVGCGAELLNIRNDDMVILDGSKGLLIVNPGEEELVAYEIKRNELIQGAALLGSLRDEPAITKDGLRVSLLANIAGPEDLGPALEHGAEGSGLFRTELLFMSQNSFPTEEQQFALYKKVATGSRGMPVTIRTLDIGGDKPLPYLDLPEEENPFLGYRAIRICLDKKDIFLAQVKAILRAGRFGRLRMMFPMIGNIGELRQAKLVVAEAKKELRDNGIDFDENMPVGVMIEIPSAAITADILARESDFFSIGTNDLCQYTLAVDRMNEKIKDLYDPFHPALLRLIANVITQAHAHHIKVSMCGEMAGDPQAALLLLGMGLDEFSMSAASIPVIKNIMINHHFSEAKEIYSRVSGMEDSQTIQEYLKQVNL